MIMLFNQELINEVDRLRHQPQQIAQTTNTITVTTGDPPGSVQRGGTVGIGINTTTITAGDPPSSIGNNGVVSTGGFGFITDSTCAASSSKKVDVAITLEHSNGIVHIPFKRLETVRDFSSAEADHIHDRTYKCSMLNYISDFKHNRDAFLSYQSMFPIIRFLRNQDYKVDTIHPFLRYYGLELKGWFFPGMLIRITLTSIEEFKHSVSKLLDSDISPDKITAFIDHIKSSLYYVTDEKGNDLALILN